MLPITGSAPRRLAALALASLSLGAASARDRQPDPHQGPVPFGVGERLEYDVSFGRLHVGSGEMSVLGVDTLDGHPLWHALLAVSGGIPLFRVRDSTMSWFDSAFVSRRFVQYINEGRYHVRRDFVIDPEQRIYVKNNETPTASSADPLDDVSIIYFVRTLPLADGDRYELQRYFQPEGNPVVIKVIRREQVTVPAGTFPAILIEPEITTSGIFSQNGRAQLWFSDDSSRLLLQMKARLQFGSINLYLKRVTMGRTP